MYKWKYFTLSELTKSSTADRLGFINNPTEVEKQNLNDLVINVLDPLREAYGKPIRVTSGYRCARLNKVVGGVENSQHTKGQAADLQPIEYKDIDKFCKFVKEWCNTHEFDQCIIEVSKTTKWVHISYNKDYNRKKVFRMDV